MYSCIKILKEGKMIAILIAILYCLIRTNDSTVLYDVTESENDDKTFFSEFLENFDENYAELNKLNELKFQESVSKCSNILSSNNSINNVLQMKYQKHMCISINPYFDEDPGSLSGKLFLYDNNIVGLITNTDMSVRFYYFNPNHKSIIQIFKKYFRNEVPYAACTDKLKNVYIVFPDEQKIGKYVFESILSSNLKLNRILKETSFIREKDYYPSTISCHDDYIYVSERPTNVIKVYDKNLNFIKNIEIDGVIISAHRAITVNNNIRLFADDSSGVAFFNRIRNSVDSIAHACHFYYKKNCIEDISSIVENKNKTLIYVADSCNHEIKQFIYTSNENNIALLHSLNVYGIPTSVVSNENGYLFVLTSVPSKLNVFYPRDCKANNQLWIRRQMK